MPDGMKKDRGKRPTARGNERGGTMYDRIAAARVKRQKVLSGEVAAPARPIPRNTINALRGAPSAPPEENVERSEDAHGAATSPSATSLASDDTTSDAWDIDAGTAVDDAANTSRRGGAGLWIVSLTIAAFLIGSVVWLSRPASRVIEPVVPPIAEIAPAQRDVVEETPVPPVATTRFEGPFASPNPETAPEIGVTTFVAPPMVSPTSPAMLVAVLVDRLPEYGGAPVTAVTGPRPQPRPTPEQPETEVDAAPVIAEVSEIPEAEPAARDLRVVLNAPRTVPDASLAAVIEALEQSGAEPDPRRVNLTISTSNVRYYHAADADAATVIADGIGAQLRDFTTFEPSPPEGLVEIWMAGREIATANSASATPIDQLARELQQLQVDLTRALRGN